MSFLLYISRRAEAPASPIVANWRDTNQLGSWALSTSAPCASGFVRQHSTTTSLAVLCSEGWAELPLWTELLHSLESATTFHQSRAGIVAAARRANGAFALLAMDRGTGDAIILTDSRGIHPVYWYRSEAHVIVGTQRHEVARACNAEVDPVGIIERNAFGAPLGTRSLYASVHRSAAGQLLEIRSDGGLLDTLVVSDDSIPTTPANPQEAADELDRRFSEAVDKRLPPGNVTQLAGISGGLDSRVIVASLLRRQTPLSTFTFGRPDTLDLRVAVAFAESLGLNVECINFPECRRVSFGMRIRLVNRQNQSTNNSIAYWSGDGGSVCVGGVYLDEAIRSQFRTLQPDALAETLFHRHLVPIPRLLFSQSERRVIRDTILQDLQHSITASDPSKEGAAYRWLLREDQRRHLDEHFAFLDLHSVHYLLPFLDRGVITLMQSLPEAWISRHELYMAWLNRHLPECVALAWQAYPGHVACPHPLPAGIYQWDHVSALRAQQASLAFSRWQLSAPPQFGDSRGHARRWITKTTARLISHVNLSRGGTLREVAGDLNSPESIGGIHSPIRRD